MSRAAGRVVSGPGKCRTSLMGFIFGHKFYYHIRAAGITHPTNVCVRCGWAPGPDGDE